MDTELGGHKRGFIWGLTKAWYFDSFNSGLLQKWLIIKELEVSGSPDLLIRNSDDMTNKLSNRIIKSGNGSAKNDVVLLLLLLEGIHPFACEWLKSQDVHFY